MGPLRLVNENTVRVLNIKRATARGLANQDSTTGSCHKIQNAVLCLVRENIQRHRTGAVLLLFERVDTQLNLVYKLAQDPAFDRQNYLTETCSRYMDFISSIKEDVECKLGSEIVVCSAFLPVVTESNIQDRWDFTFCSFF